MLEHDSVVGRQLFDEIVNPLLRVLAKAQSVSLLVPQLHLVGSATMLASIATQLLEFDVGYRYQLVSSFTTHITACSKAVTASEL